MSGNDLQMATMFLFSLTLASRSLASLPSFRHYYVEGGFFGWRDRRAGQVK
jgi:hypothetical protein